MKKRYNFLLGLFAATVIFSGCSQQTAVAPVEIVPESSVVESSAVESSAAESAAAGSSAAAAEASSEAAAQGSSAAGSDTQSSAAAGSSAAGGSTTGSSTTGSTPTGGIATTSSDINATPAKKTRVVDPNNLIRSELTNEWIDGSLKNQRPVAVMVDNELYALPHYGVNDGDIVYEIMNSTENNRVTRLMVVLKDWEYINRLGSIRSVRTTNFMVAAEYNAILCHDGGPFYINDYTSKAYVNNLSGGFARFSNGKATEFTEYVTYDSYTNTQKGQTYSGLGTRIKNAKYSTEYNSYYPGKHFNFSDNEFKLSDSNSTVSATTVDLSSVFPHNGSKLFYNASTGTYDYYEYGEYHKDAATGEVTTFKNVILQSCSFYNLDANGYLTYNVVGSGNDGYYITNGEAIPITWSKGSETALTVFKNKATGEEITLNTGKTYIAIVPSDTWSQLTLK